MKPFSCFLLSLLIPAGSLFAQLPAANNDSVAVFKTIAMADYFFGQNELDSALMMANNAARLAESRKYYKGQGWAMVKSIEILIEKKELQKADELALQINKIANREGDTLLNSVSILQRGK